jgi:hypothetical protein
MQIQAVNIWSLLLRELIMASFKEYLNQLCFDCISRLFERKCSADLSWYRFVLIPNCLGAELSFSTGAELYCYQVLISFDIYDMVKYVNELMIRNWKWHR